MAIARTESKNRQLTELEVICEKGMALTMPATGYSRDLIHDFVDDCFESNSEGFLAVIPQKLVDYIVEQAMAKNGDLDVADELVQQAIHAERFFRRVKNKEIISLLKADAESSI